LNNDGRDDAFNDDVHDDDCLGDDFDDDSVEYDDNDIVDLTKFITWS
jgi:hypothetical protein